MSDETDDGAKSRRTVLQASAGTAGAAVIPSVASAATREEPLEVRKARLQARNELPERYDESRFEEIVKAEGEAIIDKLYDEGIIGTRDFSELAKDFSPVKKAIAEAESASSSDGVDASIESDLEDDPDAREVATAIESSDTVLLNAIYDRKHDEVTASLAAKLVDGEYEIWLDIRPETGSHEARIGTEDGAIGFVTEDDVVYNSPEIETDCDTCVTACDVVGGPAVYRSADGAGCDCGISYDPTCEECPEQDKCQSGWL